MCVGVLWVCTRLSNVSQLVDHKVPLKTGVKRRVVVAASLQFRTAQSEAVPSELVRLNLLELWSSAADWPLAIS